MGSVRGLGVIKPAGFGPYRKRLMKQTCLGYLGGFSDSRFYGRDPDRKLMFRVSIFFETGRWDPRGSVWGSNLSGLDRI